MPPAGRAVTPRWPTEPSSPATASSPSADDIGSGSRGSSCMRLPPRCAVPRHWNTARAYSAELHRTRRLYRDTPHTDDTARTAVVSPAGDGHSAREVLRTDLVEELAELLHLVLLLVGDDDTRLGEHLLGTPDRRADAQGQGDRVTRPRRHPDVVADEQVGVEDVLLQLGDLHGLQGLLKRRQDVPQQIVGERPGRLDALLLVRDRGGLDRPDPDGQITIALDLPEQDDRLVAGQLDPNPDHAQLTHRRLRA